MQHSRASNGLCTIDGMRWPCIVGELAERDELLRAWLTNECVIRDRYCGRLGPHRCVYNETRALLATRTPGPPTEDAP